MTTLHLTDLESIRERLGLLPLSDIQIVMEALQVAEELEEGPDGIDENRRAYREVTNVLMRRPRPY